MSVAAFGRHDRYTVDVTDANTLRSQLVDLRQRLRAFLHFAVDDTPVALNALSVEHGDGFVRKRVEYAVRDGDVIPAYLFEPLPIGAHAAVVVYHQHNSQWHLGKSEVAGLAGNPLQAFGPELARRGFVVLAPDAICFEDRRRPHEGANDDPDHGRFQHMREMSYRLVQGDTMMRKVLSDAATAITAVRGLSSVDPERVGVLGHSYGGNTVLFHAALDERIRFACASGAACSYRYKMEHEIGIEFSEIIPGFAAQFDITDLTRCIAPRPLLLVSADDDVYSADADEIERATRSAYDALGAGTALEHHVYHGGHDLTRERFDRMVEWVARTRA